MLKFAVPLVLCILAHAAHAAEPACGEKVEDEGHLSERYTYQVAGKGRLYLHSAPNAKCLDKTLFVIPGDRLVAYSVYGNNEEWSNVTYTNKDGDDFSGWVYTNRLMFTGAFGMHMTPEKAKYYDKAARAAKAGKLGAP